MYNCFVNTNGVTSVAIDNMRPPMNTRHMNALVTAARCGSINKAATELDLSVPALKREIDNLEQETGIRIFTRSSEGLTVTAAGNIVVETFRGVLADLETGLEKARSAEREGTHNIRVFAALKLITEPPHIYASALVQYRKGHPDIVVTFHDARDPRMHIDTSDVLIGAVDPNATETIGRTLMNIQVYAVVSTYHTLANKDCVSPNDLDEFRLVVPSRLALAHITPGILPHLDSRREKTTWNAENIDIDDICRQCLSTDSVALVIGKEPSFLRLNQLCKLIPLEGYSFNYKMFIRTDADSTVREYADFIVNAYRSYQESK